jgi:tripartite-type tricarboxylate transporter receptor subunit TctC
MMMTGVDMVHVPYRGSFVNDLLAGQVRVVFASVPLIRTGKLRALAVTTTARQPALPDNPRRRCRRCSPNAQFARLEILTAERP